MKIDEFRDSCEALCIELTAYARKLRPDWELHPDEKKRISSKRYELNKQIKDDDGNILTCQYELTPECAAVALYLTRLRSKAEAVCDALDRAKPLIEQEMGARSSWKVKQSTGERIRFSVAAVPDVHEQAVDYAGDPRVPYLVDLMWRFQEATLPLIGF